MNNVVKQEEIREKVRQGYGAIARNSGSSCCGPTSCCGSNQEHASALYAIGIGYLSDDLSQLPEGANMGLSCGNPVALASLKPGETVVDLGSGGGFDVFIAGRRVGKTGRAIGVDMTPDMLSKARKNSVAYQEQTGLSNVEFRLGEIEHLPIADGTADVVISNCVINLSPDKPQVWREIVRILKPGGRVSISDSVLVQPLPPAIQEMVEALIGCIAGAVLIEDTRKMAEDAGLIGIQLETKPEYANSIVDIHDPIYKKILEHLPAGFQLGDYVTSLLLTGFKSQS